MYSVVSDEVTLAPGLVGSGSLHMGMKCVPDSRSSTLMDVETIGLLKPRKFDTSTATGFVFFVFSTVGVSCENLI